MSKNYATKLVRDDRRQRLLQEQTGEKDPNIVIRCRRCGRVLRGKSAERGFGPTCAKREQEASS